MALARHYSVLGHPDSMDCGLTVEEVFGNFAGGDFCLSEIGHRLPLRSTEFLRMDAKTFNHSMYHMDGDRTALVFLSKSQKDDLLQHWRWMEMEPGQERDKWEELW